VNKNVRITLSTNRLREFLVRWANDNELGERIARWTGHVPGILQLRLLRMIPSDEIPWTPLKRPLAEASVAIVTTSGVHCCSDKPFNTHGDASFRAIPRTVTSEDLCITHERYDRRDVMRDLNLVFPLERLLELETEGIVGHVAEVHYTFGFTHDPRELLSAGHKVGTLFAREHVDLVIFVPA